MLTQFRQKQLHIIRPKCTLVEGGVPAGEPRRKISLGFAFVLLFFEARVGPWLLGQVRIRVALGFRRKQFSSKGRHQNTKVSSCRHLGGILFPAFLAKPPITPHTWGGGIFSGRCGSHLTPFPWDFSGRYHDAAREARRKKTGSYVRIVQNFGIRHVQRARFFGIPETRRSHLTPGGGIFPGRSISHLTPGGGIFLGKRCLHDDTFCNLMACLKLYNINVQPLVPRRTRRDWGMGAMGHGKDYRRSVRSGGGRGNGHLRMRRAHTVPP